MTCFLPQKLLHRFEKTTPSSKVLDTDTESDDETVAKQLVPRIIYSSDKTSNPVFNTTVTLLTCVHGYLAPDEKSAASLLVFKVNLSCFKRNRQLSRFAMDIEFSASAAAESTSEKVPKSLLSAPPPEVLEYAPHSRRSKETVNDVEEGRIREFSAPAELNAQSGIINGKFGTSYRDKKETKENSQHHYFQHCSGIPRSQPGSDSPVAVYWNTKRSSQPHAKDDMGLDSEAFFAILLHRQDNSPFGARLKFWADGGKRNLFQHFLKSVDPKEDLRRNMQKVRECAENQGEEKTFLNFDPEGVKYTGKCNSIQRTKLGRFREDDALEKLTELRS